MSIQWYPGHMHKATREIARSLSSIDVIIEILDARAPHSSSNPVIDKIVKEKPVIKLLNKSDLSDPLDTKKWQQYFNKSEYQNSIAINAMTSESKNEIVNLISKLSERKEGKNTLTMVVGIPNVGKSSVINMLAGKKIAKTGNEPAITKGQQKINLRNGIMLIDTPGILWPKIEDPESGLKLAALGSIRNTAVGYDEIAIYIIKFLMQKYPDYLKARYKIDLLSQDEHEIIELLAKKRGCLSKGGKIDLTKISEIIADDLRRGAYGQITLESKEIAETQNL
ncbi:MAG: ribosome biogenesis GTPase YlqF [SAR92 clade bacterium]|uniref:Ribosome biogenesis GTPase A n=1 Tax=SAR92 clade bacterium TaxID=2315479 RepID=A0A520LN24_9GAMM|nr:MAG: ribosome biogenesis GTPase YlqF [SAR92 clade bacterium]